MKHPRFRWKTVNVLNRTKPGLNVLRKASLHFMSGTQSISDTHYDDVILGARENLAAHDQRVDAIAQTLLHYCKEFDNLDTETTVDFRPVLKAYASSKDLDPRLLQSKVLYKDVIPAMIHVILDKNVGSSQYECGADPSDFYSMDESHEKWVEVMKRWGMWEWQYYDHQEFVEVAQKKEPGGPRALLIDGKPTPPPKRRRR
jgi:hypothetical protein